MEDKRKDIDNLREFYKNKQANYSTKDNNMNKSNEENSIENESSYIDMKYLFNKIKNIPLKYNVYSKYFIATLGFAI